MNFIQINGFSKYQVSACGRVKNSITNKILTNNTLASGYQIVRLSNDEGVIKPLYVHHLVGKAYIPFIEGCQLDHIDRNKSNNSVENLRYLTPSQNCLNKGPQIGKSYKGIRQLKNNKFVVRLNKRYIGTFSNERDAINAYNNAARAYSRYCYLNVVQD